MGDWILLLFSAHGGRFAKRPYFRRRNPSYLFFYPISFSPKRIAKVQNHKERLAGRVQNIVIARPLPAQSVQTAFAIINPSPAQDFTEV
ncbi:MAG: hypothetical protein MSH66_06400 [Bacteroidales bacterium]|nr:hypothetical protein [Bacteroidales bacterium]